MRCVVITPDAGLAIEDRPDPIPILDQVVVTVSGAGINRADLLQRTGLYPAPTDVEADVPGLEFAGTVHAVGPEVTNLEIGDRVFGIVGGGAQSELVLTRASLCARVPDNLDLVRAGGVPEAFFTAYDALVAQASLQPGETVCIHGVGSGVGTAALQLAKMMGATVVGTSRTPAKLELAQELGLDYGVLVEPDIDGRAVADAIVNAVGGIDVTLDLLGGTYLSIDVRAAASRGRIVLIGMLAGTTAALLLGPTLNKRLTIAGTVLRNRRTKEKIALTAEVARHVVPRFADGSLTPVIDALVPIDAVEDAYNLLDRGDTFGKLVLTP
ncbi:MAG: NAD(P)H-quinone oxidoreductase [Acidimicrobiia bacterium]